MLVLNGREGAIAAFCGELFYGVMISDIEFRYVVFMLNTPGAYDSIA